MRVDNPIEIRKSTLWRYKRLRADEFIMRREISLPDSQSFFDAMGPVTAFGVCHRRSGSQFYESDGVSLEVPWDVYGVYMPPYSLTRSKAYDLTLEVDFLMTTSIHQSLPSKAFIFPIKGAVPQSIAELIDFLPKQEERLDIDVSKKPSGLSLKIKNSIDNSFKEDQRLSEIANHLKVSQTLMGRYFKKNFGLSPFAYRNQMRIMIAALDLISGAEIIDTFQTVGFEDLSQFYKQFKRVTHATPGEYTPKKSKITKK